MSGDVIDRVNEVRSRQGRAPIDPFTIQDAPPAAASQAMQRDFSDEALEKVPLPEPPPEQRPGWLDVPEAPEKPRSPLLAIVRPEPPPMPMGPPLTLPDVLLVADREASFRGQKVALEQRDHDAIARIVLEAVHRNLKAQLAEVRASAPRRVRKDVPPPRRRRAPKPK